METSVRPASAARALKVASRFSLVTRSTWCRRLGGAHQTACSAVLPFCATRRGGLGLTGSGGVGGRVPCLSIQSSGESIHSLTSAALYAEIRSENLLGFGNLPAADSSRIFVRSKGTNGSTSDSRI